MKRREFVTSFGAGLLFSRISEATVNRALSAAGDTRPAPIDLGEGITLIDYRVHPGDQFAILGEIRNTGKSMVDAPVVSLTWPDNDDRVGFSWASPMMPVIAPGGSVPIFGPLPATTDPFDLIATATFALCSPVGAAKHTRLEDALDLDVRVTYERYRPLLFKGTGSVTNRSSTRTSQVNVFGVVRDGDHRIAGMTPAILITTIPAHETRAFTVWMGKSLSNKANPVPLLTGLDYTIEISAGTRAPAISPGCTFNKPWK